MKQNIHISENFEKELSQLKQRLLEMGEILAHNLDNTISALTENKIRTESVETIEKKINDLEIFLDKECVRILAIHTPAASDLRFIISASRIVNDIESIGDEVTRMSYAMNSLLAGLDKNENVAFLADILQISKTLSTLLKDTLKAYQDDDYSQAAHLIVAEREMDPQYDNAVRSRITLIVEEPRNLKNAVHCFWILRSLERIGKCIRQINNHIIYRAHGTDVRHMSSDWVKEVFMKNKPKS